MCTFMNRIIIENFAKCCPRLTSFKSKSSLLKKKCMLVSAGPSWSHYKPVKKKKIIICLPVQWVVKPKSDLSLVYFLMIHGQQSGSQPYWNPWQGSQRLLGRRSLAMGWHQQQWHRPWEEHENFLSSPWKMGFGSEFLTALNWLQGKDRESHQLRLWSVIQEYMKCPALLF